MDPWDHIRLAVSDRRSGSVGIALRASMGLREMGSRAEVRRAARALLRAHPAMAPLWRLLAACYSADDHAAAAERFAARLEADTDAAADGARWALGRRRSVVLTHSSSASVIAALERVETHVERVVCTASLPGGEGRSLARKLQRLGFETEVVPDAAIARAAAEADLALVGADAVTEIGVVNKIGTHLIALAANEAGIGCYAIAPSEKLLPERIWSAAIAPSFESTPLRLFDAVLTERGPRRATAIRRAVGRIRIPRALERLKR